MPKPILQRAARPAAARRRPTLRPLALAIHLSALGGALVLGAAAPPAWAQGAAPAARSYDIPAGPLSSVLTRFSREAGVFLVGAGSAADGKTSPGLKGSHTLQSGFAALLAGTGLEAFQQADGSYGLRAAPVVAPPAATRTSAGEITTLDTVTVRTARESGQPPATGTVGQPLPAFSGAQVGSGTRAGLLGNRDMMDLPFSATGYTDQLNRDQQSRSLSEVVGNDPSIRSTGPRYLVGEQFFVRGFLAFKSSFGFDGLYGILDQRQPAIEGAERVEVLRGPAALLIGVPPGGPIGGTLNMIPKRATDEPIGRLRLSYASDDELGAHVDVGRRFGDDNAWGIRVNAAYRSGDTPIDNNEIDFGFGSLGIDYRGQNVRFSTDLSYQDVGIGSPYPALTVLPGFQIPAPPSVTRNYGVRGTYADFDNVLAASRLEIDVARNVTLFSAVGWGRFAQRTLEGGASLNNARGDLTYRPSFSAGSKTARKTAEVGVRGIFETGAVRHQAAVSAVGIWSDMDSAPSVALTPIPLNLYASSSATLPGTAGLPATVRRTQELVNRGLAVADTLSVLDERIQLTLGGRWQDLRTKSFNATTGALVSDYQADAFSPAAGILVKPWTGVSVYANTIEGLQEGATAPATASNAGEVFPAAITRQKELGVKFDQGDVGATVSAFEIAQPISLTDPVSNRFSFQGKQRNRGVELNVFGELARGVRLLGGVAFTKGVQVRTVGGRFDGKPAPGVPKTQVNLYGEYDLPQALVPGLTLTGRLLYTSSQSIDQADLQRIPSWTRFDLGLRYAVGRSFAGPMVLRAGIENVRGKNYWASTARGNLSPGTPRTVLVSAEFGF